MKRRGDRAPAAKWGPIKGRPAMTWVNGPVAREAQGVAHTCRHQKRVDDSDPSVREKKTLHGRAEVETWVGSEQPSRIRISSSPLALPGLKTVQLSLPKEGLAEPRPEIRELAELKVPLWNEREYARPSEGDYKLREDYALRLPTKLEQKRQHAFILLSHAGIQLRLSETQAEPGRTTSTGGRSLLGPRGWRLLQQHH